MLAEVQQFFVWKRSSRQRIKINAERIYRCARMHDLLLVSSPVLFRMWSYETSLIIAFIQNQIETEKECFEKKKIVNCKFRGPRQSSGRPIKEISAGTTIYLALARKTSIPSGGAEKNGGILSNSSRERVYRLAACYLRRVPREITPARVQSYFLCSKQAAAQGLFWICRSFTLARNRLSVFSTSSSTVVFTVLFMHSSL